VAALTKLKLGGRVLVVLADEETVAQRSFANLPDAETTTFGELSAHDVLRSEWILFSDRTLPGSPELFSTGLPEADEAVSDEAVTDETSTDDGPVADADVTEDEPTDVTADETEEAATDA
jgi:hypothetical protein